MCVFKIIFLKISRSSASGSASSNQIIINPSTYGVYLILISSIIQKAPPTVSPPKNMHRIQFSNNPETCAPIQHEYPNNPDEAGLTIHLSRRFVVRAKDNPNSTNNSNMAEAPVIVNLVGHEHYLVLSVENASPESLQKDRAKMARVIEAKTGLLVEIDRIEPRRLLTVNNTMELRHHDSDVWLYAIDPKSERILDRNSSLLHRWVVV